MCERMDLCCWVEVAKMQRGRKEKERTGKFGANSLTQAPMQAAYLDISIGSVLGDDQQPRAQCWPRMGNAWEHGM